MLRLFATVKTKVDTNHAVNSAFSRLNKHTEAPSHPYSYKEYIIDNRLPDDFQKPDDTNIFTILLNRPLEITALKGMFSISDFVVAADGAANRLYDVLENHDNRKQYHPNVMIGDLDSIRRDVEEYYTGEGIELVTKKSQDENDSQKALGHIVEIYKGNNAWKEKSASKIMIMGPFGGRLDHTLSNLSTLIKFSCEHPSFSLCMISKAAMVVPILPGKTMYLRAKGFEKDSGIGIIPAHGRCSYVKTTGLKWNLGPEHELSSLAFGDFVSSSNAFEEGAEEVTIETSDPLFFITTPKTFKNE